MTIEFKPTNAREEEILRLLWDSLKPDPEHLDRRQTGYGTKTKRGLVACFNRIATMEPKP